MTGYLENLYQQKVKTNAISEDASQAVVVVELDKLRKKLIQRQVPPKWKFWQRYRPPRGMYIWGSVGRGKTYWMDLFYDSLPFTEKKRVHFHSFMQQVHQALRRYQGEKNPMSKVADEIADKVRVICFDEFIVIDIADAMSLAILFEALFARQVVLVATSNVAPERLYEHGLKRDRFLPAIALIQKFTRVFEMQGNTDHRLHDESLSTRYYTPLDGEQAWMRDRFEVIEPLEEVNGLTILGRDVACLGKSEQAVWFTFESICGPGRGTDDYLTLANQYSFLFLSHLPHLDESCEDAARRFVHLIDTWYDAKRVIFISAETPIESIYSGKRVEFEFQRTVSRLVEMQSDEYFGITRQF